MAQTSGISDETIWQAAEALSHEGVNLVFARHDDEWLFRRCSIPLRAIPVAITAALQRRIGGEFLVALRQQHTARQAADALRAVLLDGKSVFEAFSAQGISAYGAGLFKKVLLIAPKGNYDGGPSPVVSPHRGVEQIAAYLIENTCDVDARTFNPNLAGLDFLEQLLKTEFIHVIGMSFLPVTLHNDAEVIDLIASASPHSILAGGGLNIHKLPHDHISDVVPFDLMIGGAGERTLQAVLQAIPPEGKAGCADLVSRLKGIPNLYLYGAGSQGVVSTRREHADPPSTNVEAMKRNIPYDQDDLTHRTHYQKRKKELSQHNSIPYHLIGNRPFYILNSDHCFHRCNFCSIRREKIKPSGPAAIVSEIQQALSAAAPYDSVHFSDNDFFAFPEEVVGICDALVEAGLTDIPKYCKGCADEVSPAMLSRLRKAGFLMVGYGIESFDNHILKAMNKQITAIQNEQALRWTLEAGIKPGINLIAFSPWETEASLLHTIDRSLHYASQGAYINLMPAMYTQLGDDFSSDPDHQGFIEYLKLRFKSTDRELLIPYRVKCATGIEPLWQEVRAREHEIAERVKVVSFGPRTTLSQAVQSLVFVMACLEIISHRHPTEAARLDHLAVRAERLVEKTADWERRKIILPLPEEMADPKCGFYNHFSDKLRHFGEG